jgi:hypothetical protein
MEYASFLGFAIHPAAESIIFWLLPASFLSCEQNTKKEALNW